MSGDLLKLAERCEQASGGDCDLDHAIHDLVGDNDGAPFYTRSLDAAMTLFGQFGTLISLSEIAGDGMAMARVGRPDLDGAPIFEGFAFGVMRDTPLTVQLALALTAASLRALAGDLK